MLKTLLQSLALASTGFLSVGSITIVILLLISKRGWRNGLGYALGYLAGYSAMGALTVYWGYRLAEKNEGGEPGIFFPLFLIVFGVVLLRLAFKNWRKPKQDAEEPRFFALIDKITPLKAFGFGALVTVINFKNLALFMSALSVIILSDLALAQKMTIVLIVAPVFSLSVMIPVLIYLSFPRRAAGLLGAIKDKINQYSRPIGIGIPLFFGLIFLLKGISAFL